MYESKAGDENSKLIKPSSRGLFETVKRLLEMAQMVWIFRVVKTQELMHENDFIEMTM